MDKKHIVLLILALAAIGATIHKFYLGLTDIKYNGGSQTYQISIKLFTDDLLTDVHSHGITGFELEYAINPIRRDSVLFKYVLKNFSILNNHAMLPLHLVGWENDADVTWIYLESDVTEMLANLGVRNSLLVKSFPEQQHVVNIDQGTQLNSMLLYSGHLEETIEK